ncbi:MAG: SPOR domain-containing protein [Magnetococcales bacterium]|nr:SPOR domain-containing protein [Magnetococcales bacterium]
MVRSSEFKTRVMPLLAVALLAVLNLLVQGMGMMGMGFKTPEGAIWPGPVMPEKLLELPDPAKARVVIQGDAPLPVVAEKPPEPKPESKPEPKPEPKVETKPASKPEPVPEKHTPMPVVAGEQFMVQVGSFTVEMGVDSLVERLRKEGLSPRVETVRERTGLNSVQVGPFAKLDLAKEAEARLKSGGIAARVEESWEGFVIVLGKSLLLSHAVEEMEKVKKLGVTQVRLVKVESDMTVRKVLLGPYENKERARKMSARVAELGIASPVIKTWPLTNALP